jgi:hypothetical protein
MYVHLMYVYVYVYVYVYLYNCMYMRIFVCPFYSQIIVYPFYTQVPLFPSTGPAAQAQGGHLPAGMDSDDAENRL